MKPQYTDHLAGRISSFEGLNKADLNNQLQNPLSPSKLKKTSRPALLAMVDAELEQMAAQPPKLTDLEKRVLVAYLDAGIDCNGADSLDAMLADNMTWGDVPEIAERTGLTKKQVQGVIASLSGKGLLVITDEAVNGEGPVQQVLADSGVRVAFALLAGAIVAKAPAKPARKPRTLDDRVIVAPGKLDDVKPTKAGSKRALLVEALAKGAAVEELMEVLGWNRDTVLSAFRVDVKALGLGVERRGGRYYLLLPKGVKRPPVRAADTSRADALVAACK